MPSLSPFGYRLTDGCWIVVDNDFGVRCWGGSQCSSSCDSRLEAGDCCINVVRGFESGRLINQITKLFSIVDSDGIFVNELYVAFFYYGWYR